LCMRATTDYWIHAMDGQPFFYINKEVDPGLIATLRHDLVPFLERHRSAFPRMAEADGGQSPAASFHPGVRPGGLQSRSCSRRCRPNESR
jgi:hypothetical protein